MKYLSVNDFKKYKDFWVLEGEKVNIVFSNASEGRSFNRNTEEGVNNLISLKDEFNLKEVKYLKQVHSDRIFTYKKEDEKFSENEGDAIITKEKEVIVGVFTADCVPVILVDEEKKVISAIHSGWKGTFNDITKKTIEKMKNDFECNENNIKAYIGPHIRQCCYEVSEELKEKFEEKFKDKKDGLFKGRNLSMEVCIEYNLVNSGINEDNNLFSYRKSNGTYGRLFSFCYIK